VCTLVIMVLCLAISFYKSVFTFEFPCTVNISTEFTRYKMFNYIYVAINV